MKGLTYTFALFTGLYVLLAAVVLVLLRRDVVSSPKAP
jgi:cytochrome bd-type quinol oxidase subunit 1